MTGFKFPWRNIPLLALLFGLTSFAGSFVIHELNEYTYRNCADSWPSQSIGRPGACSHHGGVVTRTIERSEFLKDVSNGLSVIGIISLLVPLAYYFELFGLILPTVQQVRIEGESAIVPLRIAKETRLVHVVKQSEFVYETKDAVALVRSTGGTRYGVYASTIRFLHAGNGNYRPDLSTWIGTGRGRQGGYVANAFGWTEPASPPNRAAAASD